MAQLGKLGDAYVEVGVHLDKLDKDLKKMESRSRKSIDRVSGLFKGLGAAFITLGVGAAIKDFTRLAGVQEQAVAQLNAGLASTGSIAGVTSQELQNLASELQKITTYGDEATIAMESILLTFTNIRGEILTKTVPAVQDMAARMGTDLKSAAIQLGKALNDPAVGLTYLSRSGVTFSDMQKRLIKALTETNRLGEAQAIILAEINNQFGGSAQAKAETYAGKVEQMSNAFGDAKERFGAFILEMTSPAVNKALDYLNKFSDASSLFQGQKSFAPNAEAQRIYDRIIGLQRLQNMAQGQLDNALFGGRFISKENRAAIEETVKGYKKAVTALWEEYDAAAAVNDVAVSGAKAQNEVSLAQVEAAELAASTLKDKAIPAYEKMKVEIQGITLALGETGEAIGAMTMKQKIADVAFKEFYDLGVSAAQQLASAFAQFATSTEKNFSQVAEAFAKMLGRMVAELLAKAAIFAILAPFFPNFAAAAFPAFGSLITGGGKTAFDSGGGSTGFGGSGDVAINLNVDGRRLVSVLNAIDRQELRAAL